MECKVIFPFKIGDLVEYSLRAEKIIGTVEELKLGSTEGIWINVQWINDNQVQLHWFTERELQLVEGNE